MDSLDDTLRRIDEALAEPDPFPWDDAAHWSPSLGAGTEEQWAVSMDPALARWYRRWNDATAPPWVIDAAQVDDDLRDWA